MGVGVRFENCFKVPSVIDSAISGTLISPRRRGVIEKARRAAKEIAGVYIGTLRARARADIIAAMGIMVVREILTGHAG